MPTTNTEEPRIKELGYFFGKKIKNPEKIVETNNQNYIRSIEIIINKNVQDRLVIG